MDDQVSQPQSGFKFDILNLESHVVADYNDKGTVTYDSNNGYFEFKDSRMRFESPQWSLATSNSGIP